MIQYPKLQIQNYITIFLIYFTIQAMLITVNTYFPIYFFNVLEVNRAQLALMQFFAYSAFISKPLVSIFLDKKNVKNMKVLIMFFAFILIISFLLLIYNTILLILFGILLAINFTVGSILDALIDKVILTISVDETNRQKCSLIMLMGSLIGVLLPTIYSSIIFSDDYKILSLWNYFFMIIFLSSLPLIVGVIIFKNPDINLLQQDKQLKEESKETTPPKTLYLMIIFYFLFWADRLYEYPFEPWVVTNYCGGSVALYSMLMLIVLVFNIFGYLTGYYLGKKQVDKRKLIIGCMGILGIVTIIWPFTHFWGFFTFSTIIAFTAGIALINGYSIVMEVSLKNATIFQTIMLAGVVAIWLLVPLGTYLTLFFPTEIIIILSGIISLTSIIPLLLLDYKPFLKQKEK